MSKYVVGNKVRKNVGYPFVGTVCATYDDEEKCCVKHADGWEHIFHDKQLTSDHPEYQYLDLLKEVMTNGVFREGRNGGTYSVFGRQIRFNLAEGFPLLTTKKVHWKSVAVELLWFLRGDTNIAYLKENGVSIWDEWADENGELGPVYGAQWRKWGVGPLGTGGIDQIRELIENLKTDPYSRRHVVSSWSPNDLPEMALPPCHCLFQFYVQDGKLSCQLYQRSVDLPLGSPFNIASYALLTHIIAREVGLGVGDFVYSMGDIHVYHNQIDAVHHQLDRVPYPFPTISIGGDKNIFDLTLGDINLNNYISHARLNIPVSA